MNMKKTLYGVILAFVVLVLLTPMVSQAGTARAYGGANVGAGARYGHSGSYYGGATGGSRAYGGATVGVQHRYYGGYYGPRHPGYGGYYGYRYPGYWGARYWGPRYWGPNVWLGSGYWWGWPYYGYPYYSSPPAVVQQPPVYVEPNSPPQEPQYWYYCQDPQGYYPYVKQCPNGWMKVVPPDNPPGR
jgi:hypothetical protein